MKEIYDKWTLKICLAFAIPLLVIVYKKMPELSGAEGNLLIFLIVIAFIFSLLLLYVLVSLVLYGFVLLGRFLSRLTFLLRRETKKNTKKIFSFTDFQKLSLSVSVVSLILLGISIWAIVEREDLDGGFYVFLRILVFGTLTCLCFERLSIWWKTLLILDAILFNPFIQIHLDDSEPWIIFDIITFFLVTISWIILFRKMKVKDAPVETR